MSDALTKLHTLVQEWRETREEPRIKPKDRNPHGQKIYDLNMAWNAKKKAALAAIEEDYQRFLNAVAYEQEQKNKWDAENHTPATKIGRPGRHKHEHPVEIKKAAAQAIRDGFTKTQVRIHLGITNTERLNEILATGEALLQTDDYQEKTYGTKPQTEEEPW